MWPNKMGLADSNVVYGVVPELPSSTWRWAYGLHLAVCIVWLSCLSLRREMIIANAIFAIHGFMWLPFTNAWWTVFIVTLVQGDSMPVLRGICACSAAPTAIGWYGTQLVHPDIFMGLVNSWAVQPVERHAPRWFAHRWSLFSKTRYFEVLARLGDFCLHFAPTTLAFYLWHSNITAEIALAVLPGNMVYWLAFALKSGATCFADTNWIYGVSPNIPNSSWMGIFASHWLFCFLVFGTIKMSSVISTLVT